MKTRTAEAAWSGDLREGSGTMRRGSGTCEVGYSFGMRMEDARGTKGETTWPALPKGVEAL